MTDHPPVLVAAVGLGRDLRRAGLPVGMAETLDFVRALGVVGFTSRDDVRSASRAIFVRRHEDLPLHDEVFDAYWARRSTRRRAESLASHIPSHRAAVDSRSGEPTHATTSRVEDSHIAGSGPPGQTALVAARRTYSAQELLRRRDFDRMTADELREAARLIDKLAPTLAVRPARRYELHAHGVRLAPRPMLRRSLATGGELVEWRWARPRVVARPVTLLIDVSGSMESYARLMLRFAHVLRRVNRRTEVFVFGTRLTRVTRALATRRVDDALARVSAEVRDWSGGTRIGECLREYNRRWAARVGSSDGIVAVLSDGWDRGDPALVATETARLRRNCRRLLWLNPLAGSAEFQPLAAGMAAAARHVDRLLPAASLADLEGFASALADGSALSRPERTWPGPRSLRPPRFWSLRPALQPPNGGA